MKNEIHLRILTTTTTIITMHIIFLRLGRFFILWCLISIFIWWVSIGVLQCHQDVQKKIYTTQHCQCPIVVIQSTFIQCVLKPICSSSPFTEFTHNINRKDTTNSSCSNYTMAEKFQVAAHWGGSLINEELINAEVSHSFNGTKKEKLWKKPEHAHWDFLIIVVRIVKPVPFNHV